MRKIEKAIYLVALVAVAVISVFSFTYAYITARLEGGEDNPTMRITSKNDVGIIFTDGDVFNPDKIAPGWSQTKTFTIENKTSNILAYDIKFTNISNGLKTKSDIKYEITSTNSGATVTQTALPTTDGIVTSATIPAGETQVYSLTVYYINANDRDQTLDKGKEFSFKVEVK